jgi:predicted oxidoreductase
MNLSPIIIGCMKLGTWGANLSSAELERFIDGCLDLGLTDFDHADIYGGYTTERQFGEVIRRRPDLKNKVRITTKCGIMYPSVERPQYQLKHYNLSADHIRTSIDRSLENLGMDELHVFLLHRPDVLLDPAEIAEAFTAAKQAGKIGHVGVSNFTPSQFDLLHQAVPLETNQVQASLTHLSPFTDGTLDQLLRLGITPTAWSPLGGGKLFAGDDAQAVRIREAAAPLCEVHHCTLDQLLLAWLMRHPAGIIPVTGTSKLERIKAALEATTIHLTHEEWYQLWTASTGEKVA